MPTRFRFSQLRQVFVLGAILAIVFAFTLALGASVVQAQTTTFPPTGKIAGVVFYDINGNGVRDIGEPGVANVGIVVLRPGTGFVGIIVKTDPDGYYEVDGLLVGVYTVVGNVPGGFTGIVPTYESVLVTDDATTIVNFALYRLALWMPQIGKHAYIPGSVR